MSHGFVVRAVRLSGGPSVPHAELSFSRGGNVVTGPSDTGKSYLLHVIEYALGRNTPPKAIPEAKSYDWALVQLESRDGSNYVLRRHLREATNTDLYECSMEAWHPALPSKPLLAARTSEDAESLSMFLLGLCNLASLRVKCGASKTEPLSFRHLRPFFLVDEARIISEQSPARPTGQHINRTREDATMKLLLTGVDDSSLPEKGDLKVEKASWKARAELLDRLIQELQQELDSTALAARRGAALTGDFQRQSSLVERSLVETSAQIAEVAREREQVWRTRHRSNARLAAIAQLLAQFDLLQKQYDSDAARLEFISEGEYLLAQVGAATCPLCGTRLGGDEHVEHDAELVRRSCDSELTKLKARRVDLQATIDSLRSEQVALQLGHAILSRRTDELEIDIAERLRPRLLADQRALAELADARALLARRAAQEERLNALREERNRLGSQPKRARTPRESETAVDELQARRKFCDALEVLLGEWRFPEVGTIEFDPKMNLLIKGVPARSHGKGYRAVINAAFAATLMLESFPNGHPGLVVLDSPLTSLREKNRYEAPEDVQQAFFEWVSRLDSKYQIIVLENKEPPLSLRDVLHYGSFTGVSGSGRSGLFPP